jgi:vancomycin resistance protein YoaR
MIENPITFADEKERGRALRWFLLPPLVTFGLLLLGTLLVTISYQAQHSDRVFTGVSVWGVDLSQLTREEARTALATTIPDAQNGTVELVDPGSGQTWQHSPASLGIKYDLEATVDAAYRIGRDGGPVQALRDQFTAWYYGQPLAPVIIFDEADLYTRLDEVAAEIERPALDSSLEFDGNTLAYMAGQIGRRLDVAETALRLSQPLSSFRNARVELLVHEIAPHILDSPETTAQVQAIVGSPMTLYFREPLADLDLDHVVVSPQQLAQWLRVEMVEGERGAYYRAFIDREAARQWLSGIEAQIYRQPQNARFYFDDDTGELVLVEPHVNGRALNVEATLDQFMAQVGTNNRTLPLIVEDIQPTVHSKVTAAELGITGLLSESTTWFYGSTPERKHNIARAAAQFFGIVIAPGEEFSFNRYLGNVTEEAGFTTGLVIIGGQTVEGIGGGVCQVSTTLYQAAFWAGYPITARLEHGYRVHYYDDGEGPGMDATVFEPLVDLRFVNNTDHYLLIENYYNETFQSLTFKFYSTSVGRTVEKDGPVFENVTPPKPDTWEYNEELEEGEIIKVDWAVEGADVTVVRRVFDENGTLMYGEENIVSNYIPWGNVYQYGPGVDPDNVDPRDIPDD